MKHRKHYGRRYTRKGIFTETESDIFIDIDGRSDKYSSKKQLYQ